MDWCDVCKFNPPDYTSHEPDKPCGDCWVFGEGNEPSKFVETENRPTNYDRLISKTPDELAEWLAKQEYKKPTFDGWLPLCNKVMGPRICHEDGCEKCWLSWLKSPVEVDK